MASSCVPAGPFESAGAELSAYDLETLMHDKWVLGLAEGMNVPAVIAADDDIRATGAPTLRALVPCVTPQTARRFVFCTDDPNPLHLLEDGHVDSMVRQAIALGLGPLLAPQPATPT